jgi:ribosomal protein S18 acetylase RimI-like enzyme
MSEIMVRKAIVADARMIAEVHVRSMRAGYAGVLPSDYLRALSVIDRSMSWYERLVNGEAPTVALDEQGGVAGFALSSRSPDQDVAADVAELRLFYIEPSVWGRGFGSALWCEESQALRSQGFAFATLWVLADNDRARRFYEHHGFRLEDHPPRAFRDADFVRPQVRYRRSLLAP